MRERRTTVIKRTTFVVVMTITVTVLLLANHELNEGANYIAENSPVPQLASQDGYSYETEQGIAEPEDAYTVVQLTFGGNCTPASMLGSSTYGTFNAMAEEEGTGYFLSRLSGIFAKDDCTVLGCAAVFGDDSLSPIEKEAGDTLEWYLAPKKNMEIFSSSGVEVLSVANSRVKDYGAEGVDSTQAAVTSAGMQWSNSGKAVYLEKAGIRLGLLCTSLSNGGDSAGLTAWVEKAAESCQYVMVYVEREASEGTYYTDLAHSLIDAGCDFVCYTGYCGENGAVSEAYGEGIIVDSLGYLLDGGNKFPTADTALYCLELTVDHGVITQIEGQLIPVKPYEEPWQPVADTAE